MKTFDDLVFKTHPAAKRGIQAVQHFSNGYGVSVVGGADGLYGDGVNTFELAVLKGQDLCYDTPIADDVMGYLTQTEVTDVMKQVQELKGE